MCVAVCPCIRARVKVSHAGPPNRRRGVGGGGAGPALGHFGFVLAVLRAVKELRRRFSRWSPAGLRMTCDNIGASKGQA